MKKIFFSTILFAAWFIANAQNEGVRIFKPFKVDVSAGYAIPQGSGSKGGAIFAVEPKYAVMDRVAVGLRLEGAVIERGLLGVNPYQQDFSIGVSSSYLLTGDYYFSNNTFRPFAGGGFGLFEMASIDYNAGTNTVVIPGDSKFGFMLRGGFEAGHFRLGAEYNFVSKSNIQNATIQNGYFGIKLGVVIGGGRIRYPDNL